MNQNTRYLFASIFGTALIILPVTLIGWLEPTAYHFGAWLAVATGSSLILLASQCQLVKKSDRLRRFAAQLDGIADLSDFRPLEVDPTDELAEVKVAFNRCLEKMQRDKESLASQQVSVENTNRTAKDNQDVVYRSTEEVSKNMREVAASIDQMTSCIKEVAKSADVASQVAARAAGLMSTTNDQVGVLGMSAKEIGNVVTVIEEFAEQTNLLALNATIEAARAGDAGKGFAVVASEVKALASQTAQAAVDIRQRIESIQSTTDHAVAAMKEMGEVVDEVNSISTTIASAVEEQGLTTRQIAERVAETADRARLVAQQVQSSTDDCQPMSLNPGRGEQMAVSC